jgi:CBS domain containing-hemolysin-like protein
MEITWLWSLFGLLSVPLFVAMNGLFVAAEFALVAVRKTRVEEMVHHGQKGAQGVESAVVNLDRSIAATQLGITLASLALGWAGEPALAHFFQPMFDFLPAAWKGTAAHSMASVIAFFLITFLHVVFGELIPKTMALQMPDGIALWVAAPLNVFANVGWPLIRAINGTGNAVLRFWGFQPASGREMVHSIEELSLLIEDTEEAGILGETQADVVQQAFRLSGKHVRDCMVPRDKMAMLELTASPEKVLEAVRLGAHTRMPVYKSELDNIVGIVNTKDLFHLFSLRGAVILEDALYPPRFLKPDDDVAAALQLFLKAHRPMALVREESGGVLGLITLEDILEEIVGEIEDEHDPHPLERLLHAVRRETKPAEPAPKPPPAGDR